MIIRTYSELIRYETLEERFDYLQLKGNVGEKTFGFERYINQRFYTSTQWRKVRQFCIARDLGNDLAVEGHPISTRVIIHHMNPMTSDDLIRNHADILDPEFLITISHETHNAVHYGDRSLLPEPYTPRQPGDTKLW